LDVAAGAAEVVARRQLLLGLVDRVVDFLHVELADHVERGHGYFSPGAAARSVSAISSAAVRARASSLVGSDTAPTTGWPPPPYFSQSSAMLTVRRAASHGFEPTDTLARVGVSDTPTT